MHRIVAVGVAGLLVLAIFVSLEGDSPNVPNDLHFKAERFQALEWIPRYRSEECYAEYEVASDHVLSDSAVEQLRLRIAEHLYRNEHRTAGYPARIVQTSDNAYLIEVRLLDDCGRREEIANTLLHLLQNDDAVISAARNMTPPIGRATADTFAWTDNPGFDPTFWEMKNKSHHGDYTALMWRGEYAEQHQDSPEMAMVFFQWAANCAADAGQRERAIGELSRLEAAADENRLESVSEIRARVQHQMKSYGVKCLPLSSE